MRAAATKRLCGRHRRIYPAGERCPECRQENTDRGRARRHANSRRLGRYSPHWRALSFRLLRRWRLACGVVAWCPKCLRIETASDASTKLTVDLVRGGDHRTATEDECEIKCRRCHGREQGARR